MTDPAIITETTRKGQARESEQERATALTQISETLGRYAYGADQLDKQIWNSVFTSDATLDIIPPREHFRLPAGGLKGKSAIIEFIMGGLSAVRQSAPEQRFLHVITNLWLDNFDGRAATAHTYMTVVGGARFPQDTPNEANVLTFGRYKADMLKTSDGQWLIMRMEILAP